VVEGKKIQSQARGLLFKFTKQTFSVLGARVPQQQVNGGRNKELHCKRTANIKTMGIHLQSTEMARNTCEQHAERCAWSSVMTWVDMMKHQCIPH
jgi:hypothetical protein